MASAVLGRQVRGRHQENKGGETDFVLGLRKGVDRGVEIEMQKRIRAPPRQEAAAEPLDQKFARPQHIVGDHGSQPRIDALVRAAGATPMRSETAGSKVRLGSATTKHD